jgi:hypothetical protein
MAKAFSVASWNVEHFKNRGPSNAERIAFLAEQQPDVAAIYEAEGSEVWRELMDAMPNYSFFITEGQNTQEILLGTAPGATAFVTQKIEFQSRDTFMRPGAFLTVRVAGEDYGLLFLHVASMPDPRGFGLRADMIDRAFKFRGVLDRAAGGWANYIFLGDLNTMGLDYVYGRESANRLAHARVSDEQEIAHLHHEASKHRMRVLSKTSDVTWGSAGGMRSNLDHVVAADHLDFRSFAGKQVDVRGWPTLPEDEQTAWIEHFSDHALLYFEVQRTA